MVQEKMDREACEKLSPVLKYLKDQGKIVFKYGDQVVVEFWNGSRIWVDVADDSSRGKIKKNQTIIQIKVISKVSNTIASLYSNI